MKFEQNWPRGSRGEVFWNSEYFSHTNAYGSKIDLTVKGQMSMYDHYFSNFGNLQFPMIYVKILPQGILGFGEQDWRKVFYIQLHTEANLTLP